MVHEMESTGKSAKRYITVAHLDELPDGGSLLVQMDGHDIALFRFRGEVYAMSDLCPHMGDSLSAGQLWEGTIICPRHMWAFRLKDGVCEDVPNLRAPLYEVRIVDGAIQVAIPPDGNSRSAETGECGDCGHER